MQLQLGEWTWLEIFRLGVSAVTPLVVAVGGYFIHKRLKEIEQLNWANQKIVEKRISFYFEVVPQLNDLLCYYTYVGNWKELKPPQIISLKRALDRQFYVNRPLFPPEVFDHYETFIACCYKSFTGWGKDAKLRSSTLHRKGNKDWDPKWNEMFAEDEVEQYDEVRGKYTTLVTSLAKSLGVGVSSPTSQ